MLNVSHHFDPHNRTKQHSTPRNCRCVTGMTLTETLVAGAFLGLAVVIVALGITTIRTDLKRTQVQQLLATLDRALITYHDATGSWPIIPEPPSRKKSSHDSRTRTYEATEKHRQAREPKAELTGTHMIATLSSLSASRAILEQIPAISRVHPQDQAGLSGQTWPENTDKQSTFTGWGTLQDAWGRPLRCLTTQSASPVARQAVAANGGKPIFISAGVDGEFGGTFTDTAADNLRSDELPR